MATGEPTSGGRRWRGRLLIFSALLLLCCWPARLELSASHALTPRDFPGAPRRPLGWSMTVGGGWITFASVSIDAAEVRALARHFAQRAEPTDWVVITELGALAGDVDGYAPRIDIWFEPFVVLSRHYGGLVPSAHWTARGLVRHGRATLCLWPVALPLWVVTARVWWRSRRGPRRDGCGCGYDLTGNVSGRCPECGKPVRKPSGGGS